MNKSRYLMIRELTECSGTLQRMHAVAKREQREEIAALIYDANLKVAEALGKVVVGERPSPEEQTS